MILTLAAITTYMEARQVLSRLVDAKTLNYIDSFKDFDDATAGHLLTVIDYQDDLDSGDSINSRQFAAVITAFSELKKLKHNDPVPM